MKLSRLLLPILLVAGVARMQGSRMTSELDGFSSSAGVEAVATLCNGGAAVVAIFVDDMSSLSRGSVRSMWGE